MARFLTLLHRWESAELNQEEAAALLGVSERTFRGWTRRYEEEGEAGLLDRRLGQASGKRVPVDRAEEVERLYRERYPGFTVKPFHEHLVKDHGFGWGYAWTKLHLQWAGVVPKAPRKGAHRRKRERRPLPRMMLHQDAPGSQPKGERYLDEPWAESCIGGPRTCAKCICFDRRSLNSPKLGRIEAPSAFPARWRSPGTFLRKRLRTP
jgi:transposase